MSSQNAAIIEVLQQPRDLVIGKLLRAIADALDTGATVRHEPLRRDVARSILRDGPLHLPRRDDLRISRDGRTETIRLSRSRRLHFATQRIVRPEGLVAELRPLSWDGARLFIQKATGKIDWSLIRRWYLEAFQSCYSDLAPDLDGSVHALLGPYQVEDGWEITIDFGSAPLKVFTELIDAVEMSGATLLEISGNSRMEKQQVNRPDI